MKKFLLIILILFSRNAVAQHHYNAWFRVSGSYGFSSKFSTNVELQYRKQNGFGNENLCDKELMQSARLWFYYQQKKQVMLGFSPIALFEHHRIIQLANDEKATPVIEKRMSAMFKAQTELKKKLHFVAGTKAEYRTFNHQNNDVLRLRQLIGLNYKLSDKMEASFSDELFVNALGVSSMHIFDQNRILLQLSYSPKPKWKLEVGYVHINRILLSNVDIMEDENFFINLNYKIR